MSIETIHLFADMPFTHSLIGAELEVFIDRWIDAVFDTAPAHRIEAALENFLEYMPFSKAVLGEFGPRTGVMHLRMLCDLGDTGKAKSAVRYWVHTRLSEHSKIQGGDDDDNILS